MKHLTSNLLMVAAALMLSVTAFAAEDTTTPTFELLDANQDGYISSEEAASYEALVTTFEKIDANQDGKLDAAEYSAFDQSTKEKG